MDLIFLMSRYQNDFENYESNLNTLRISINEANNKINQNE